MKRVLVISYARGIGGGEIYLSSLLPRLNPIFNLTILASPKLKTLFDAEVIFKNFRLPPKKLDRIPRNYRLRKIYYQAYFKKFKLNKYDLISLQDFDGALIEAIDQKPIILTLQTRFLIPRQFDESVRQRFEKIDKVVCVSQQTKKDLVDRGIPATKCQVIHNAIDPAKYTLNKQPGRFITWIGRVEQADKNPLLFLQVAKAAQNEDLDVEFRIVGSGSYLAELKKKAQNWGLKNIDFFGFCPPEDIYKVYQDARLLCMTSTSEGLPFVALEAMASGVPVVATKVGGLPELIDSQAVGELVDNFEPTKILRTIFKLVNDPAKYQSVQAAARQRIEKYFSLDAMAKKTAKVYSETMEQK